MNQNPAFLALGIIFYRFHNLLAAKIQQQRPDWEDEDVFQAARRRVIATLQVLKVRKIRKIVIFAKITLLQNIIMYEYLPSLLGEEVAPYAGYKPDVPPGISHVFQSAAFR